MFTVWGPQDLSPRKIEKSVEFWTSRIFSKLDLRLLDGIFSRATAHSDKVTLFIKYLKLWFDSFLRVHEKSSKFC